MIFQIEDSKQQHESSIVLWWPKQILLKTYQKLLAMISFFKNSSEDVLSDENNNNNNSLANLNNNYCNCNNVSNSNPPNKNISNNYYYQEENSETNLEPSLSSSSTFLISPIMGRTQYHDALNSQHNVLISSLQNENSISSLLLSPSRKLLTTNSCCENPTGSLQSIFAPPHPIHCNLLQSSLVKIKAKPNWYENKLLSVDDEQKLHDQVDCNSNVVSVKAAGDKDNEKYELHEVTINDQSEIEIINSFESPSVRGQFLRRVLAIVGFQLIIVTSWTLACIHVEPIADFIRTYNWLVMLAIGIYVILYFAVGCLKVGRAFPSNLIIIFLFTSTLSYICGHITLQCTTWIILISLSVTITNCMILYVVTLLTKVFSIALIILLHNPELDVTGWGIYLAGGCGLMMLYASTVFTCSFILTDTQAMSILNLTGAFFGSGLVSLYLLYDIQLMIGGHYREIDAEEWLFAAMALFYDVVMIFVYLLQITGVSGGNRPTLTNNISPPEERV